MSKKRASAFRLQYPDASTEQDIAAIQQLILKNDTHSEVLLEGSIKQLK